ncbi:MULTISPECIES: cupin domain-containing protein [unclassified Caballeronia]|uniref:cupin domain-containing protein n=1 Tax=unclassified Caballeronia TaxID=2646786 RepID=UPI001F14EF11|nr:MULTISPECIES: cupin domain-containing protein [unclassified Caballeronia]
MARTFHRMHPEGTILDPELVNLSSVAEQTKAGYCNQILATVNDHAVHLSVMDSPFFWHFHPDSDEVFIVLEGVLLVELETARYELKPGEMLTVPAGVRHRTSPLTSRSVNLTVEKMNAQSVRVS